MDFELHAAPQHGAFAGQAPAAPQPLQGLSQAAVGSAARWQDLYELCWDQQKAMQTLLEAQQMRQVFPQSPFLVALVQRLQEELRAWGE